MNRLGTRLNGTNRSRLQSKFEVFCYAPFLLADGLGLSGIVAILFTGLVMKRRRV